MLNPWPGDAMIVCQYKSHCYLADRMASQWTLYGHPSLPSESSFAVLDQPAGITCLRGVSDADVETYPSIWWEGIPIAIDMWCAPWDEPHVLAVYAHGWGEMQNASCRSVMSSGFSLIARMCEDGWTRFDALVCTRVVLFSQLDLSTEPYRRWPQD